MSNETHLLARSGPQSSISTLKHHCASLLVGGLDPLLCTALYSVYNIFLEKTSLGAHTSPGGRRSPSVPSVNRIWDGLCTICSPGQGCVWQMKNWTNQQLKRGLHSEERAGSRTQIPFGDESVPANLCLWGPEHKSQSGWLESRAPELTNQVGILLCCFLSSLHLQFHQPEKWRWWQQSSLRPRAATRIHCKGAQEFLITEFDNCGDCVIWKT